MKRQIVKGSTDVQLQVFVLDSASTTGAGKTGIAYNAAGLTAYYSRPGAVATVINLATQTVTGAHADGGWVEISSGNMPGFYRFDIPDALVAAGVNSVVICVKGAAGMAPLAIELELIDAAHGANTAAERDATADAFLSRTPAAVEGTAGATSIAVAFANFVHRTADSGAGTIRTYKSNGTSVWGTRTITATDAALAPIKDLAGSV